MWERSVLVIPAIFCLQTHRRLVLDGSHASCHTGSRPCVQGHAPLPSCLSVPTHRCSMSSRCLASGLHRRGFHCRQQRRLLPAACTREYQRFHAGSLTREFMLCVHFSGASQPLLAGHCAGHVKDLLPTSRWNVLSMLALTFPTRGHVKGFMERQAICCSRSDDGHDPCHSPHVSACNNLKDQVTHASPGTTDSRHGTGGVRPGIMPIIWLAGTRSRSAVRRATALSKTHRQLWMGLGSAVHTHQQMMHSGVNGLQAWGDQSISRSEILIAG